MPSLQKQKQRLCKLFNVSVSEVDNKITSLQSVIQDDTISESILCKYLLKAHLDIEQAINLHFKSPSPSPPPARPHSHTPNTNNSNNSECKPLLSINRNICNISLLSNRKKRKRNDSNPAHTHSPYTPLNKRRKIDVSNANNTNNSSNMKHERDFDNESNSDIQMQTTQNRHWQSKVFGALTMEYSVNKRYTSILSLHHIPQSMRNGDITVDKYCQINAYMSNAQMLSVYYQMSFQELKSISKSSHVKIVLKQKNLIFGKSDIEIANEYKKNETEANKLRTQQRIREERQRLILSVKKKKESSEILKAKFPQMDIDEYMNSLAVTEWITNVVNKELRKNHQRFKTKPVTIDSKYRIEFGVSLHRKENKPLQISFEKLHIPYTICLLSNTRQLHTDINNVLCVRTRFERQKLPWHNLGGLLDFAIRYSYEINESNNNESFRHGLNVSLYEYQLQSLAWMIREECDEIGFHRHLYTKGLFKDKTQFLYSTVFQHLLIGSDVSPPIAHGGFLCEEMGLGKTIISLALINCNQSKLTKVGSVSNNQKLAKVNIDNITYYKSRATLIIAPVTLVGQWEKEIDSKNISKVNYKTYYAHRSRDVREYIDRDIVLTTYDTIGLESGLDRNKHCLHQIQWHRIILDESDRIRNSNIQRFRNINRLRGINKWLVTGTPFNNSIADVGSQLRFIGVSQAHINRLDLSTIHRKKLFNGEGNMKASHICIPIMNVIRALVMRHKKSQKFNGKPIVRMVGKTESVIYIEFSDKQREFYDKLYEIAKQKYKYYQCTGNVGRGTIAILSALFPARQACSGHTYHKSEINLQLSNAQNRTFRAQSMVKRSENRNKSNKELFEMCASESDKAFNECKDTEESETECPICYECPLDLPLQTPCRHVFCGECIKAVIRARKECPLCREKVEIGQLKRPFVIETKTEKKTEIIKAKEESKSDLIKFDTKLKRLISEIKKIKQNNSNEKSLIFTSFSNSLDWICNELRKNKLEYRTLAGSMSMRKRKRQMEEFSNNKNVSVFVLTVRTGAVGITLTAANHVFMMEPTFNPSLHRQAINRVYRLGQKRKVFIHTMIMKGSIEERIWNINKHKYENSHRNKNSNSNSNMAGNITSEKNIKLQQHEISKLFE